jgi:hypothetical protein
MSHMAINAPERQRHRLGGFHDSRGPCHGVREDDALSSVPCAPSTCFGKRGMMASHENNDEQIRGMGLGRRCHYFQSSAPIDINGLHKIMDYYKHEAIMEDEDKEEGNRDIYLPAAAVAGEEQEEQDNDTDLCPSLEDDDYLESSGESPENENEEEKEDWEILDDNDLCPNPLLQHGGWDWRLDDSDSESDEQESVSESINPRENLAIDNNMDNPLWKPLKSVNSVCWSDKNQHDEEWFVDSEATVNVTRNTRSDKCLEHVTSCDQRITVGNGNKVNVLKQSDIILKEKNTGTLITISR